MAEPWDIPDPCHFESCSPVPCGPCEAGSIFNHPRPALPGVPVGRVVVPLVRVNGQVQDLNVGNFISNQFLEPPHVSWDPMHGTLNIGGRFVKLTGVGSMMYSDCHGQTISPCTPVMTCANFAEIINASTGVGFKVSANPFAGLTVILRQDSGLVLDNGGLGINWTALCNYISQHCSGNVPPTPPGPGPTPPGPGPTPPGPGPTPPGPGPTPPGGSVTRTGIPYYDCHNEDYTSVSNPSGTISITWSPNGIVTASSGASTALYSGTSGAAYCFGGPSGGWTLSNFNAITLASSPTECSVTPPGPGPGPGPTPPGPGPTPPGPGPTPPGPTPPDTSPKSVPMTGCFGYGTVNLTYSGGSVHLTGSTGSPSLCGDVTLQNSGVGVIKTFSGCNTNMFVGTLNTPLTDVQYAAIASINVSNCYAEGGG